MYLFTANFLQATKGETKTRQLAAAALLQGKKRLLSKPGILSLKPYAAAAA